MTIYYVDLVSGDDNTGNGTTGTPWKTIDKGTTSRSAGDEVRVKKSTMSTLSGTLTFTNGSASVSTSVDLTGEVAAGDLIGKNSGNEGWWAVASRTSSVITLENQYYTDSGSGNTVTAYKITPTTPAATQYIKSAGAAGNLLKVSGGWDFSGPTQNGLTAISFGSSAGALGTDQANRNYFELNKFIFHRLTGSSNTGIYFGSKTIGIYIHDIFISGVAGTSNGFFMGYIQKSRIEKLIVAGGNKGINVFNTIMNSFKDIYIYSVGSSLYSGHYALSYGAMSYLNSWDNLNCYNSYDSNLNLDLAQQETFKNSKLDKTRGSNIPGAIIGNTAYFNVWHGGSILNSTGAAINVNGQYGSNFFIGDVVLSGNSVDYAMPTYTSPASITILSLKKSGADLLLLGNGWTAAQKITHTTTGARTGSCLKIEIPNADYPRKERIGSFKIANTGSNIVAGAYIKKDGTFNGSVYLCANVDGKEVVSVAEKTVTESYVQQTVTVNSADLVMGKYIELFIVVFGSAGVLYVDDFSAV